MITVTFYTNFSKRVNSTLRPTGGTNLSVLLKEETSIEKPTFILSGTVSTFTGYNYALWDGRYYYVTDVRIQTNGVVAIDCDMDKLATFKTEIGSSKQFIERCVDGNGNLRDDFISTTCETYSISDISATATLTPSTYDKGIIVLTLANISPSKATGGTSQIVYFDASGGTYGISQLMNALYDTGVIQSIEKIMNKPYDAILSVKYIPGFTSADLLYFTTLFSASNILYFGDHAYSGTINTIKTIGSGPWVYSESWEYDLNYSARYGPYVWRNLEPYSTWSLYLPFYGNITIPAQEYINCTETNVVRCNLLIKSTIDLTTGELVYIRYRKKYYSGGTTSTEIAQEYRTNIGIEIPLQSSNRDMLSFASDIIAGVGSVALMVASGGSAAGVVAMGASSAAKAVVDVAQQNYMTAGSFNAHGTQISTAEPTGLHLIQTGFLTQTDPGTYKDQIGIPYMKADTISNHSGYIKCGNASVDIPGHVEDKEAVNAYLNSGFFYE